MLSPTTTAPPRRTAPGSLSTAEFVAMVAALTSLNALAIDIMLPAVGQIASDFSLASENDAQLVVVVYLFGFGAPQLIFGPLADRLGRRAIVHVSLAGYVLGGVISWLTPNFELLLVARFAQGVFAAGARVVAVAIVRDVTRGDVMARIMSLVMTVFMIVPIAAPALGQAILLLAPWRYLFATLVIMGASVWVWVALRLPETHKERREGAWMKRTLSAYREVLRHRPAVGYMLAAGVIFGALFGFISSSEQVFRTSFGLGESFSAWFAGIATMMGAANLLNSRLVTRFGVRRVSHIALIGFTLSVTTMAFTSLLVGDHIELFYPLLLISFAFFGLIGANFSAMAMDPLGPIAGTGAALYGFCTSTLSAFLGGWMGRSFDGTTGPLAAGYTAVGCGCLVIVLVTERGRLFGSIPTPAQGQLTR